MDELDEAFAAPVGQQNLFEKQEVWTDPITGELIEPGDYDQVLEAAERAKQAASQLRAWEHRLRSHCAKITETDEAPVTRRLKGKRWLGIVTMPPITFDQSILKEAWNSYPELAKQYMRIQTLSVRMREYNKLVNTKGDKAFEQFKSMMIRACQGRVGVPRVKIVKLEEEGGNDGE